MSDYSDYSEDDSDEEPTPRITTSQDPAFLLNDMTSKMKHFKSKYRKSCKERERMSRTLKDLETKLNELNDVKKSYEKLRLEVDVERRSFEIQLANEAEQTKKLQVLLNQSNSSLEGMGKRHREIVELNKKNEAKLFQSKIEHAGVMSTVASLEEQLVQLKDELQSAREIIADQTTSLQTITTERNSLAKEDQIKKTRIKEVVAQLNEYRGICDSLDKKFGDLAQDHATLKANSEKNTSQLNKSVNEGKEETTKLVSERDSLRLKLSHAKETLSETQTKFSDLQERYTVEKDEGDKNRVLLKQAEMSIQHLKELYGEKDNQSQQHRAELEKQISALTKELDSTRQQLREAQDHTISITHNGSLAQERLQTSMVEFERERSAYQEELQKTTEIVENEKISWSGKEVRYLKEIKCFKRQLEELTEHYQSEIRALTASHEQQHTQQQEETERTVGVLRKEIVAKSEALSDYGTLISRTIHILRRTHYSPHSPRTAQRGGNSAVNSTSSEQIATLNTELGHLTATSEHLKEKLKQLEEEKLHEVARFEKLTEEKNCLFTAKSEIEIELSKQRDAFKDEIRALKNDLKNNENKFEVLKKKLDSAREELGRMEHELRAVQAALAEKSNANTKFEEELGSLKTGNSVVNHQLNEVKITCADQLAHIENLKTRLTVVQEDNKSVRAKSEESLARVKEREDQLKVAQDQASATQQQLHAEQIKHMEALAQQKDALTEQIHGLEVELKHVKYDRDSKESQIGMLREQIQKKDNEKLQVSSVEVPVGISEEAAAQYRELMEKFHAQTTELQQLKSEKIIADNTASQLKYSMENERDKLTATEMAVKETTNKMNELRDRVAELQGQGSKKANEISRLEEMLRLEKERGSRSNDDLEELRQGSVRLNSTVETLKAEISTLREALKTEEAEKAGLQVALTEKERMLSSEAKLRLHMTAQMSSNSGTEAALESERKKAGRLEERCEALTEQIDRLKASLEEEEGVRRKLREEMEVTSRNTPSTTGLEEKIRGLKQKLAVERETARKAAEDLGRRVRKAQEVAREEAAQRKELTEKYIAVKSEIGETQGKMAVLLSENERLKSDCLGQQKENAALRDQKNELETRIRTDFVPRNEVESARKDYATRNRVEINKKIHEFHQRMEQDTKSREAIEKVKAQTEWQMREELEASNRQLKNRVEEATGQLERSERNLSDTQLENQRLKHILTEERRATERLLSLGASDQHYPPVVPTLNIVSSQPSSPRSPLRQCENVNNPSWQDANTAWQIMKSKLNESLNRYIVEDQGTSPGRVTPGRLTPGRLTPGRVTPGRTTPRQDPEPIRTSADSFL